MTNRPGGRSRHLPSALAAGVALALLGVQMTAAQPLAYPHLRDAPGTRIFAKLAPSMPGAQRVFRANAVSNVGQVLPVTSCADDGPGSLRAVVTVAADHDRVDLRALNCSAITLSTGAIVVHAKNLTLQGPGAARLAIDGDGKDRVLLDAQRGELVISGLTIRHGQTHVDGLGITGGACIADAGYLTLVHSVVSGCIASAEGVYGGGVYTGVLTMVDSTLSGNIAYGDLPGTGTAASGGGGYAVYAYLTDSTIVGNASRHRTDPPRTSYDIGGGLMIGRGGKVTGSTIERNAVTHRGGGIFSIGDMSIDNSTISANISDTGPGGGVFMRIPGMLTITSSTVSGNHAADGGGIALSPNGGTLRNTIVFGNRASAGASDLSAASTQTLTGDHNLIGGASATLTLPTDTLHRDPQLLPLARNGGITRTQGLPAGSPAIDRGSNPSAASFDQRGPGYPRVVGASADIGAFEWAAPPPYLPVPSLSKWAALLLALGLGGLAARQLPRRLRRCAP